MNEKDKLEDFSNVYFDPSISHGFEKLMHICLSEHILSDVKNNVLEVGCGDGEWTKSILTKVDLLDVVEPSTTLANNLKEKFTKKVNVHNGLYEHYETSKQYDYIILTGLLHHVEEPTKLLIKARQQLKDGGVIKIVVPNAHSLHRQLALEMKKISDLTEISELGREQGHRRVYTIESLKTDIVSSNLKTLKLETLITKIFPNRDLDHLSYDQVKGLLDLSINLDGNNGAVIFCEISK